MAGGGGKARDVQQRPLSLQLNPMAKRFLPLNRMLSQYTLEPLLENDDSKVRSHSFTEGKTSFSFEDH